jgi:hypothetical protein
MTTDEKISMIYGRNLPSDYPKPLWYVGNVPATPRLGLPQINLEDGPQVSTNSRFYLSLFELRVIAS